MTQNEQTAKALDPKSKQKLFFGLFVFPLLIAVGMAVLLCTIVLLTNEEETPETLITSIKTGAPSKRWQKAFELSNELNSKTQTTIRQTGILKEAIHILGEKEHYDSKTRAYMAMTVGRFHTDEALMALHKALTEVDVKNDDAVLPIFLMWSIGNFENPRSAEIIKPFLESEDPALRKTAAYALGALKNPSVIPDLARRLDDLEPDVQWNAALSLARLGSSDGAETLFKMIDRNYLEKASNLAHDRVEAVMVNAAKGLALLNLSSAQTTLENISKTDPSMKVRQAAISALQTLSSQVSL